MPKRMRSSQRKGPTRWELLSLSIPAGLQVAIAFGAVMLLLLLVGGAAVYYRDPTYSKWIGKTEEELLEFRSKPQWEGTDRDGRRILVYERTRDTRYGRKISRTVVYLEKGELVTSVSSLLPAGHTRASKYQNDST